MDGNNATWIDRKKEICNERMKRGTKIEIEQLRWMEIMKVITI